MTDDIDVSDVESAEKARILSALRSERKARHAAERELKSLRESAALGAQPSAEALTAHVDALVRAELAKQSNDAASRVTMLEKELTDAKLKLSNLSIKTAIKDAARAAHMRPDGVEHAVTLALLELRADDKGELRTKDGRDVTAFIDGLKQSAPFLWPLGRGAGGRGSVEGAPIELGSNPWTREGFNLTAQGRIAREAPERARQLQAQAAAIPGC